MLAILFLLFQLSSSCEVKQQSNDQTTPCQFPFILGNTTYYGCTTYLDPDGKLWCSTRTNDQSEHIGQKSFWGYCQNPSCPNDEQIKNEALKAETSLEKLKIDNRNAGGCPCTPFRNCPWSSQLMEYVANLPKYHPARTSLVNYIGANTCNSTAQAVFCCNPVNQETSTEIPKTTPRSRTTTIQVITYSKKTFFKVMYVLIFVTRIWVLGNQSKENVVPKSKVPTFLVGKTPNKVKYHLWLFLVMSRMAKYIIYAEVQSLINGTY